VWTLAHDLLVTVLLMFGYCWLAMLTVQVRKLSLRLALHVCRDPVVVRNQKRQDGDGGRQITVAELLAREHAADLNQDDDQMQCQPD
jgi:hypothetical protein